MSLFEAGMLLCFGASWPVAIIKTWQTKNPVGKSVIFLWLVLIGYFCGIANKVVNHDVNWVLGLYILNALLVAVDLALVLYFQRRNQHAASAC